MWRNEQRNLEAEARVLVEQLRDLVASNATLRANYVAKLRALTNTDFTMGGQVMAKWKTFFVTLYDSIHYIFNHILMLLL